MNTKIPKSPLYDKRTAGGLSSMIELISDVYNDFEINTWSNNSDQEIGFYKKDKITKSDIFLGIWFESWEQFEIPLCIAIDYIGKAPVEKHHQIKKFLESKNIKGAIYKDYKNYSLILFDEEFYNFTDDADRLADIFEQLANFVGIKS